MLFSILTILLSKRKVTREYLAERFSVSVRTVARYLVILADAGIPVRTVSGTNGGVYLPDDYILDRTFLTEAETIRIKQALERTSDSFGDKVNLCIAEKLDAVSKSREGDRYVIDQADLFIDCEYEQAELLRPKIKLLSRAIKETRSVDIKYTDSRGAVSYRTIEPYTLVFKSGAWYIYAMCKLRGDFRLFKLTRISDIRLTSKSYSRVDSRLIEKLELEYYNEVYVDLEFEFFPAPKITEAVTDWLGADAISERGTKMIAAAEVPLNDALYSRLLSFGSSIKVLKPDELAQKIKDDAKLLLDIYD